MNRAAYRGWHRINFDNMGIFKELYSRVSFFSAPEKQPPRPVSNLHVLRLKGRTTLPTDPPRRVEPRRVKIDIVRLLKEHAAMPTGNYERRGTCDDGVRLPRTQTAV